MANLLLLCVFMCPKNRTLEKRTLTPNQRTKLAQFDVSIFRYLCTPLLMCDQIYALYSHISKNNQVINDQTKPSKKQKNISKRKDEKLLTIHLCPSQKT